MDMKACEKKVNNGQGEMLDWGPRHLQNTYIGNISMLPLAKILLNPIENVCKGQFCMFIQVHNYTESVVPGKKLNLKVTHSQSPS